MATRCRILWNAVHPQSACVVSASFLGTSTSRLGRRALPKQRKIVHCIDRNCSSLLRFSSVLCKLSFMLYLATRSKALLEPLRLKWRVVTSSVTHLNQNISYWLNYRLQFTMWALISRMINITINISWYLSHWYQLIFITLIFIKTLAATIIGIIIHWSWIRDIQSDEEHAGHGQAKRATGRTLRRQITVI